MGSMKGLPENRVRSRPAGPKAKKPFSIADELPVKRLIHQYFILDPAGVK